ncbi:MAG: ribosome-associated translation inhibitor RaiA [Pseudomonadota bacterium]
MIRINGKHMDVGDALSQRIEERIAGAVDKYFGHGFSSHVTMEKSGGSFSADCMVHLDSGVTLEATGSAGDAHAAFDGAAERLEKRLRRYKRRLKDHHANANGGSVEASYTVIEAPEPEEEIAEDFQPVVVAESSTPVRTQTVAMAVMQLDMTDQPCIVFKNAASGEINVVFRRKDGHIGWVDPAASTA